MKQALSEWWSARSTLEKVAVTVGAGALGAGVGCAVVAHGLVVVTPKVVIAIGPAAKILAKGVVGGLSA